MAPPSEASATGSALHAVPVKIEALKQSALRAVEPLEGLGGIPDGLIFPPDQRRQWRPLGAQS